MSPVRSTFYRVATLSSQVSQPSASQQASSQASSLADLPRSLIHNSFSQLFLHNRFTTKKHDTYSNLILKCMHTNPMYSFDSSSKFGSGQLSFLSCKTPFPFFHLLSIMTLCVSNSLCPLFCGPAVVCLLARQHSCSISMQPFGV